MLLRQLVEAHTLILGPGTGDEEPPDGQGPAAWPSGPSGPSGPDARAWPVGDTGMGRLQSNLSFRRMALMARTPTCVSNTPPAASQSADGSQPRSSASRPSLETDPATTDPTSTHDESVDLAWISRRARYVDTAWRKTDRPSKHDMMTRLGPTGVGWFMDDPNHLFSRLSIDTPEGVLVCIFRLYIQSLWM